MGYSNDWTTQYEEVWDKHLGKFKGNEVSMLEIGVFEGRSTVWFHEHILTNPKSVHYAVDPFMNNDGVKDLKDGIDYYKNFMDNVDKFKDKEWVVRGKSVDVLMKINKEFDIIYVDGSHDPSDCLYDISVSWTMLKPGGVMMIDDVGWPIKNGSPRESLDAWMRVNGNGYNILHLDLICILEKI